MRTRVTIWLLVVPALVWALYGLLGERASAGLSARFGARIVASSDDKFPAAQPFIKRRLKDVAVLLTSACLVLLLYRGLAAQASRRLAAPARWIAKGWSAFICLNVFAAVAAHTVLYWCLVYSGKPDVRNDYTQYRIKEGLLEEIDTPSQALLMGASQTRYQIDAKVLNQRLASRIWTTQLYFPGSSVYDTVLCLKHLPRVRVDYIITYLSEANIYAEHVNLRAMYFFGLRDLVPYLSSGPGKPDFDANMICGMLKDVVPLYRIWESLVFRIKFWDTVDVKQEQYNATLESDLVARARRLAKIFYLGPESSFQKRCFVEFAQISRERGSRLVVCCGQFNPILDRTLDPALHADMVTFLHEQAAKDSNIILLEGSQMPRQVEGDYDDLAHANAEARARFSHYMAGVLENLTQTNSPQGQDHTGMSQN